MAPKAALEHFANLVPGLNITPDHFEQQHQAEAFKLAEATDSAMLARVKGAIQRGLEQGEPKQAVASIQGILDDAGVSPKNPQYAEMVFRTNAMSAYNAGSSKEMQDPDVAESFPVWQWASILDGRGRPEHEDRNENYYPNDTSFEDVRDADGFDGYNCRCSTIPIFVDDWNDLQADGAEVSKYREGGGDGTEFDRSREADGGDCGASKSAIPGTGSRWPGPGDAAAWRSELVGRLARFSERPASPAELRAYLERFCGGIGSGRPGPCPGEGGRPQTGPTTTAAPVQQQPLTETQLHQAADQESKKTIGLFGRMMASVKNLPVVKQLTQLHSYAQLQAIHLYNGLANRYGTANANAILARGTFAGAGGGFTLAVGQKLTTIASAAIAETYLAMRGKHAEQDGPVDMALVDREAAKFWAQLQQQVLARAGGQEFAELATSYKGGDCDGDVCAGGGGRRGGNVAGAGAVLLPEAQSARRSARLTELRDYLERYCGGKGSGRPGPCPEPKTAGSATPDHAEQAQHVVKGIRSRLSAGVQKILSGIDSATHGSISLLAAGHPAQAAASAFNSVFQSVHEEVYEAALSQHSIPGAAVVAKVGATLASKGQAGLLKAVGWAMGKLTGTAHAEAFADTLGAADQSLLNQLTDLAAQELASLGLQPDRQRLAGRILAALRGQQPTAHAEIPAAPVPQSRSWTCGPAALASAAQTLGLPITEQQAQQALGATPDEGTPPERLLAGAKALGLRARAHERMELSDLEAELATGYPVIVCMVAAWEPSTEVTDDSGHWSTVVGAGPEGITLADPAAGRVRLTAEEFVRRWRDQDEEGREYTRLGIVVSR